MLCPRKASRSLLALTLSLGFASLGHSSEELETLKTEMARLATKIEALEAKDQEEARRQKILTKEIRRLREDKVIPPIPTQGKYGMAPVASKVYQTDGEISIGGYGQAWYTNVENANGNGETDRLDFVRNVLYFGKKFSENLVFNTEIEWEHANSSGGSVSVEFAQLDFLQSDELNLRMGLLLVPSGFVNEIHEPLFYYGNQRPEVERRIIPSTWRENGAGIFGTLGGRTDYRLYVLNGLRGTNFSSSGIRSGRQKGSDALADDLSAILRVDHRVSDQLSLGGSIYTGGQDNGELLTLAPGITSRADAGMTLWELHGEYKKHGFKFRSLFAQTHLSDADKLSAHQANQGNGPVAERMKGAYAELGYDFSRLLPSIEKPLELFFRYESFDTQDRLPVGFARDASQEQRVRTWGIQYQPDPRAILKLDYRNFARGGGATKADEWNLGFGWAF